MNSLTSAGSVASTRTSVLKAAANHAEEYLGNVNARPVPPPASAIAALKELAGPVPPGPSNPQQVLDLLARFGSPATIANGGGRYFGFVNGGCVPAAMAAAWLV